MEKTIIYYGQDSEDRYYTEVQVTMIPDGKTHKKAREELSLIEIRGRGANAVLHFFLTDADADSFRMKIWGNAVEDVEGIGYIF